MSGKYFEYILWILLLAAMIIPAIFWRWRMRLRFLQNLARMNILKRQQKNNQYLLYSAYIINRCCLILFLSSGIEARSALKSLVGGYIVPAADFIRSQSPQLAVLLQAHADTITAYTAIKKHKIITADTPKYGIYLPILAHLTNDYKTLLNTVGKLKIDAKHCRTVIQAYGNAISAYAYLHEGDMLSASQNASAALTFFQKHQYAIETASCHLILAQIYRISCVNDIAQTMIESAIKIYQTQKTPLFLARAITAKGMLMVFDNRYEEAETEYEKALKLQITDQLRADIFNQKALLYLVQNNISAAQKYAKFALDMQKHLQNRYGSALSLQLLAHAAFQNQNHRKTVILAQQAHDLYNRQANFSAVAECLYLAAEAEYKMRHYTASEKILRRILELNRVHSGSFHTANAYSLLGLIYLQKNDLQRAKVLFQQSLYLEQSSCRNEGLAADYANLALIDDLSDYTENAAANWQTALEYARKTGNQELVTLIEKRTTDR